MGLCLCFVSIANFSTHTQCCHAPYPPACFHSLSSPSHLAATALSTTTLAPLNPETVNPNTRGPMPRLASGLLLLDTWQVCLQGLSLISARDKLFKLPAPYIASALTAPKFLLPAARELCFSLRQSCSGGAQWEVIFSPALEGILSSAREDLFEASCKLLCSAVRHRIR